MAKKLSPLTPVNEWPTRKLPQQRFDDEVKTSMNQMSKMISELNNPFIPTVNEIIDDVNVCVENIELIQAAPGHAATAQQKAQEAAASATKAQQQATLATQKATAAASSAAAAAQSEKDAQTAQAAAEAAQAAAEASKNAAATSANTATQKANAAAASATTAQQQATTATQKASAAATSASQSAASAAASKEDADRSCACADAAQAAQEAAEAARDEAQNIAGVGPATPGAIGFVKPDSKTTVTDGAGTMTTKDVAIGGDLTDLASERGQIGKTKSFVSDYDINSLTKAGCYYVPLAKNAPDTTKASFYSIQVHSRDDENDSLVTQVAYSLTEVSSECFLRRTGASGALQNWNQIVTAAKLGDGIKKVVGGRGVATFSVPEYQGATASATGVAGLVPPATAAERNMALLGSGEYGVAGANKVTLSGAVTGTGTVDDSGNMTIATTGSSTVMGVLTKKATRTTTGTWTISGLTAYKPVFLLLNFTASQVTAQAFISNITNCYSPIKDGVDFSFLNDVGGVYADNNVAETAIILIPKTTSISCNVQLANLTGQEITAWQ